MKFTIKRDNHDIAPIRVFLNEGSINIQGRVTTGAARALGHQLLKIADIEKDGDVTHLNKSVYAEDAQHGIDLLDDDTKS